MIIVRPRVVALSILALSMTCLTEGCGRTPHAGSVLPSTPGAAAPVDALKVPGTSLKDQLPVIADDAIDANIDAALPADERSLMRETMRRLPAYARSNVVYVDTNGHIYANHAALKAGTHLRKPVKGAFVDERGKLYAAPPEQRRPNLLRAPPPGTRAASRTHRASSARRLREYNPPQTTNSGPYFRFLPAYFGYTMAEFGLTVPHGATTYNSVGPQGDIGYVYTGGWNEDGSDSVDAGFQYSAARDVMNVFLSSSASGLGQVYNNSMNFVVGRESGALFHFDGTNIYATGYGYNEFGQVIGLSVVEQPRNARSWASGQDVVKYMVTIGQAPTPIADPGFYLDGYSFGANGRSPTIHLEKFVAGVWQGTYPDCSYFGTSNCADGDQLDYELVPDFPQHMLINGPSYNSYGVTYTVGLQLDDAPGPPCSPDPSDPYHYCAVASAPYTLNNTSCAAMDYWGNWNTYYYNQTTTTYTVYDQTGNQLQPQFVYQTNDPQVPCASDGWQSPGSPAQYFGDYWLPQ